MKTDQPSTMNNSTKKQEKRKPCEEITIFSDVSDYEFLIPGLVEVTKAVEEYFNDGPIRKMIFFTLFI